MTSSTNAPLLIDSGVLFALFDRDDAYHSLALKHIQNNRRPLVCNPPVVTEVTYLLGRWCGVPHQLLFLEFLLQPGCIVANLNGDLKRIIEIMDTYRNVPADFTDASLLALAERINCAEILSTNQRGFTVYQPRHVMRLKNLFFET